jgi:hypothetical protein
MPVRFYDATLDYIEIYSKARRKTHMPVRFYDATLDYIEIYSKERRKTQT